MIFCLFSLALSFAHAAGAPVVGKRAAAKYFQSKGMAQADPTSYEPRYPSSIESLSSQDHYLAVGISSYTNTKAYNWGSDTSEDDVGKAGVDMSYRLNQDYELFDQMVRVSYSEFKPVGKRATKMSFLYGITFPDAGSQFPLYFGLAAGPGIFFKQIEGESSLALDYQMFVGLRLFNLFEKTGFFVEGGLKNHLHITSDGQLNGTFVSAGAVFTF